MGVEGAGWKCGMEAGACREGALEGVELYKQTMRFVRVWTIQAHMHMPTMSIVGATRMQLLCGMRTGLGTGLVGCSWST